MITIPYSTPINTSEEILYNAQIIAKAFSDALDQNECNLKALIGFEHEIRDTLDTVQTLKALNSLGAGSKRAPNVSGSIGTVYTYVNPRLSQTTQVVSVAAAVQGLKNNCFKCKLGLPKISLQKNFSFSLGKLKAQIKLFTDIFDALKSPNLCQVAYAFQYSCVPDILKLIALLLSVYSAILAARKISSISINGFIKGLISSLVNKLMATFSIQIDLSQTGIGCLINALEEIANAIPDGKSLTEMLSDQVLQDAHMAGLPIDPNQVNPVTTAVAKLKRLSSGDTAAKLYTQLQKQTQGRTDDISTAFKEVSAVVTSAVDDFQEQLGTLFGLLDYLQCELARSGTDFTDIIEYMNNIVNIINMLSAIIVLIAKKQILADLCTTKNSRQSLEPLSPEDLYKDFTDLDQADIISEYMGKVTDLVRDANDEVVPLIYNKDKPTILPKLDMYTCNLKEFIEAHTLPNITKAVLADIVATQDQLNAGELAPLTPGTRKDATDFPFESINTKNKWDFYQAQYTKPVFEVASPETGNASISEGEVKVLNSNTENALKTILDFVYNNPMERSKNATSSLDQNTTVPVPTGQASIPTPSNTSKTKYSYEGVEESDRTSFEIQCRKIDDVLSALKTI